MWAILKREIKAFFQTPTGYIYMGVFLFLSGIFFALSLMDQTVNYSMVLGSMTFTLLFTIPILTMRLIAEERKTGTDQLLLTSPVSLTGIIIAKYLSALFIFTCTLAVTLIYPLILFKFATMDFNVIMLGYVGFFLIGAAFIAIGLFVSSITENQIVAAIISFCMLLFLWIFNYLKDILPLNEKGQKIIDKFSITTRYEDFVAGMLNVGSVIYFLSIAAIFLFFTLRVIEKRRWSKG